MEFKKLKRFDRIYTAEPLLREYKSLFGKSEEEYNECLRKAMFNLTILDTQGLAKALTYQQFEKLTNEELYAIRHVGKQNPRILFGVFKDDRFVLLSCCKEKDKKDYDSDIELANRRAKELKEKK